MSSISSQSWSAMAHSRHVVCCITARAISHSPSGGRAMSDLEQRVTALRHDIDALKAALQTTTDEADRAALHMRLNESIRASLRLIDERLQAHNAYLADKHRRASHPSATTTAKREHLRE